MKKIFLLVTLSILISNCNSTQTAGNEKNKTTEKALKSKKYTVFKLYEASIQESNPTLHFNIDEKTVSGFSGCNTYSCSFKNTSETIDFQYPMATKMYCPDHADLEKTFFKALSEVRNIHQEQDMITLMDANQKHIIIAKTEL